jgi:hypothetical protein
VAGNERERTIYVAWYSTPLNGAWENGESTNEESGRSTNKNVKNETRYPCCAARAGRMTQEDLADIVLHRRTRTSGWSAAHRFTHTTFLSPRSPGNDSVEKVFELDGGARLRKEATGQRDIEMMQSMNENLNDRERTDEVSQVRTFGR